MDAGIIASIQHKFGITRTPETFRKWFKYKTVINDKLTAEEYEEGKKQLINDHVNLDNRNKIFSYINTAWLSAGLALA
jgi:hypothetical protein